LVLKVCHIGLHVGRGLISERPEFEAEVFKHYIELFKQYIELFKHYIELFKHYTAV
jgi:hypothetical protein